MAKLSLCMYLFYFKLQTFTIYLPISPPMCIRKGKKGFISTFVQDVTRHQTDFYAKAKLCFMALCFDFYGEINARGFTFYLDNDTKGKLHIWSVEKVENRPLLLSANTCIIENILHSTGYG